MPCYQINLVSVEFNGNSKDILLKMGGRLIGDTVYIGKFGVNVNLKTGIATGRSQSQINLAKVEYSKTVVKEMAKKKIWQYSENKQTGKITLTKW